MDNNMTIQDAWKAFQSDVPEPFRQDFSGTCWSMNDGYVCEPCQKFAEEYPQFFDFDLNGQFVLKS